MSSTAESQRLDLYNGLREVLGTERATTLMTYLPSIETPDLLTRTEFKAEMAEFKAEMAGLRGEMAGLRGEMGGLEGGLRGEMGGLEGGLRGEMAELNKRIDRVLLAVVGGQFVMLAAVFTSAALL